MLPALAKPLCGTSLSCPLLQVVMCLSTGNTSWCTLYQQFSTTCFCARQVFRLVWDIFSKQELEVASLQRETFGLLCLVWPVSPVASVGQSRKPSEIVLRNGDINDSDELEQSARRDCCVHLSRWIASILARECSKNAYLALQTRISKGKHAPKRQE